MQASSFFSGSHHASKSVKWLIIITVLISLLSPVTSYLFAHYFHVSGPSTWFPLSLFGLQQGWLWQVVSYFFLQNTGMGISFALLISLFFNMLILWLTGSEIDFRFGTKAFLFLYIGSGVFSGLVGSLLLFIFSSPTLLVGNTPAIFALMVVWTMLYPNLELFFFFLLRLRTKWLVALYLGLVLIMRLSYGEFIAFFVDISGILCGFVAGRLFWKLPNPYPLNLHFQRKPKVSKKEGKIIDITVFHELDDAFMDRMLEKIANEGELSLTKRERERMRKISERKKQNLNH